MTAKNGYDIEAGIVSVAARSFDGLGPAEIQAAAPLLHDAFRRAEREAMHRAAAKPGGASRRQLAAAVSDAPGCAKLVAP
jgi:hypothetical protein